jgi:hypothetical protein
VREFQESGFVENPSYLKKGEYGDRRGRTPLPAPPPIIYSLAGFDWVIGRKFPRLGDYSLSQPGSPQWRAMSPGSVTKYRNNRICRIDLRGFLQSQDVHKVDSL